MPRRCCRNPSVDSYSPFRANLSAPKKKRPMWQSILIGIAIALAALILLIVLAIWVALPVAFMQSVSFQRFIMFMNIDSPKDPKFDYPEKYGIEGVVNFYVETRDIPTGKDASIGSWVIIPEDEMDSYIGKGHSNETASEVLENTKKPVVLYMHGVACNRIKPLATYRVLRQFFVVVSPDHRGYGDSGSNVELSEMGVVNDTIQLYKWIRARTNNTIYVWGHSLGAGLSAHTVKLLKEEHNIVPMGLVMESAFTTMREELANSPLTNIFKWLPYFKQTIVDPPETNGFLFRTTTNILSVDCPIMIMHAEDDNVIPYFLGKRLYDVAKTERDNQTQGVVTYHQFPAVGYQHIGITDDPKVPQYIREFMEECIESNMGRG